MEKGKPNVDLANEVILLIVFFLFHCLIFLFFFNEKDGTTPLLFASEIGCEQIVQILLEKGKANVHLTEQVIIIIIIFNLLRMKKQIKYSYF